MVSKSKIPPKFYSTLRQVGQQGIYLVKAFGFHNRCNMLKTVHYTIVMRVTSRVEYWLLPHPPYSMKKTDLYKNLGSKINGQMKQAGVPMRTNADGAQPDRREQRKLDQAQGLVPFALKLNIDLVTELNEMAKTHAISINELTAELLRTALKK